MVERFVQQYVTDCMAQPKVDFDSDHKVLITEMNTPKTRKARWKKKEAQKRTKKNLALLRESVIRTQFSEKVSEKLAEGNLNRETTESTSTSMVTMINEVASTVLPDLKNRNTTVETWKGVKELNKL